MQVTERFALGFLGAAALAGGCGGSSRLGQPPCVSTAECAPGLTCTDGYCISFTPPPLDAAGQPTDSGLRSPSDVDAGSLGGMNPTADAGPEPDATAGRDAGPPGGPQPGQTGAECNDNTQCGSGLYCAGTGCTAPGTCSARPEVCAGIYDPVCACDGRTYSNACNASVAGFRVSSAGACP